MALSYSSGHSQALQISEQHTLPALSHVANRPKSVIKFLCIPPSLSLVIDVAK